MANTYNVLIIEDHPLIIEAYKRAFLEVANASHELTFNIDTAKSCDEAILKINKAKTNALDLVFLDIKLPPSQDGQILSGEDLGIYIRENLFDVKIIIATTYNDNFRINSIFKTINPEGFLVKNDLNPDELIMVINVVLKDIPYYSKSVLELMRKKISNEIVIDAIDRKLLYELSMGSKMSELPEVIPLSIGSLEKRKRTLKEIFGVGDKTDKELLKVAAEKGFI